MKCGRCANTCCAKHALPIGQRCPGCESDYEDEAPTRRQAKVLFAPPVGVLAGGVLFGLLLPLSIGGAIGMAIMCAIACVTAVGASAGACKLVDRNARALFLREKGGGVPTARLLPAPRHHR